MKTAHIALLVVLLANAAANILIKEGMKAKDISLSEPKKAIFEIVLNPLVLSGLFLFGANLAGYSYVLSKIDLSVAYPIMTSAGFLIVVVYSLLKLKEKLSLVQVCGIVSITAGIVLVSSNLG